MLDLIASPPTELRRAAMGGMVLLLTLLLWSLLTPGVGPPDAFAMDKLAHAGAFAVLGAVAAVAWPRTGAVPAILAGLLGLAVATELAQLLVPGRSGAVGDGLADMAGAAVGIAAVHLLRRRRRLAG